MEHPNKKPYLKLTKKKQETIQAIYWDGSFKQADFLRKLIFKNIECNMASGQLTYWNGRRIIDTPRYSYVKGTVKDHEEDYISDEEDEDED